jgi:hypothetical protein
VARFDFGGRLIRLNAALQKIILRRIIKSQRERFALQQEPSMAEFGDIFDYHFSMMAFEYLNLGFFAAYGLGVIWLIARPIPGRVPLKAA